MRCCCSQASRLCCLLTVLGMCHKAALPCHVPEFIVERSLLWSMQFISGLGRRLAQAADPTCQLPLMGEADLSCSTLVMHDCLPR